MTSQVLFFPAFLQLVPGMETCWECPHSSRMVCGVDGAEIGSSHRPFVFLTAGSGPVRGRGLSICHECLLTLNPGKVMQDSFVLQVVLKHFLSGGENWEGLELERRHLKRNVTLGPQKIVLALALTVTALPGRQRP